MMGPEFARSTPGRTASMDGSRSQRGQRIPTSLQSVFLKSNRGKEVVKPPPRQQAQKVFTNNWIFRRTGGNDPLKKQYEKSKDRVLTENKKNSRAQKAEVEQVAAAASLNVPSAIQIKKNEMVEYTLQEYFEAVLTERGYAPDIHFDTLETGYYNKATDVQIASYGPRMIQIVRSNDVPALRETLVGGLSPNPCNKYGESLLHMVCRRGGLALLNTMVDAGCVLQVSDDFGRTPLHDACWSAEPAFDVVKVLLNQDAFMFFMKDKRGSLPLTYVPKPDWAEWREWLDANMDTYFPEHKADSFAPSDLCYMKPNSCPLPEFRTNLSLEIIAMVANGDLSPREARLMAECARRGEDEESTVTDSVTDYDGSDCDSDYDSDYDSDEELLEDEAVQEMLQIARAGGYGVY